MRPGSSSDLEKRGEPWNPAAISLAFARLASGLWLKGISHHTFRHAGATVMVANGVSLRVVQVIGGWTSLRMVERYAHVDDAELARAVRITRTPAEAATQADTKTDTAPKIATAGSDSRTESK